MRHNQNNLKWNSLHREAQGIYFLLAQDKRHRILSFLKSYKKIANKGVIKLNTQEGKLFEIKVL